MMPNCFIAFLLLLIKKTKKKLNFSIFEFEFVFENHFAFFGTFQAKNLTKMECYTPGLGRCYTNFIGAYYHDKVSDLMIDFKLIFVMINKCLKLNVL